jgi:hypothetical protein
MTEALPMDVDFEFNLARLAKIANNDSFVGLSGSRQKGTRGTSNMRNLSRASSC